MDTNIGVLDAALLLGVSPDTIRSYIKDGKLPAYRLLGNGYFRIPLHAVRGRLLEI